MSLVLCDYLHETLLLLSDKETPLCGIERIENIIQVEWKLAETSRAEGRAVQTHRFPTVWENLIEDGAWGKESDRGEVGQRVDIMMALLWIHITNAAIATEGLQIAGWFPLSRFLSLGPCAHNGLHGCCGDIWGTAYTQVLRRRWEYPYWWRCHQKHVHLIYSNIQRTCCWIMKHHFIWNRSGEKS